MQENILNREGWLQAAVSKLRPLFLGAGYTIPDLRVSVGWPSSGGLSKVSSKTIGQCWFGTQAADGKPQLFISPLLDDVVAPGGVLATLTHEIIHTIAGVDAKHGPRFKKIMDKVGLTGKPTATVAGTELIERLNALYDILGPYPHSKIVPTKDLPKQTTRMKKCSCEECGYVARTVKKWLELSGPPLCPCNSKVMILDGDEIIEEGE